MPTEFFTSDVNLTRDKIMLIDSQHQYLGLNQITPNERFRILNLLKVSDEAMRCLSSMGEYGIQNMNDKLIRFIQCNFGELDHVSDITENNALNFEYVNCGFKGNNHCHFQKKFCVLKTKLSK